MNWDAIGAIAEMIGGIAVLITLVYLAVQVRHANRIQRQTLLSNQTAHWVANCQTIGAHPELSQAWHKALRGADLTREERRQWSMRPPIFSVERLMPSIATAPIAQVETVIMYLIRLTATAVTVSLVGALFAMPAVAEPETAHEQVWAAENAFAQTMRERNLEAFGDFIADEAVFFAGTTVLRGKSKVIEEWAQYFNGPEAPFSWEPDQVEVLESGSLALSTGPVRDPTGKVVARFNSIWRLEVPNGWKVVFDKGSPASPGPP